MKIAIITGASSGLGRQFALLADKDKKHTYEEIWLIARRRERLEQIASELTTPARILPLDLTKDESINELSALIEVDRPEIRLLINAAGYGKIGGFAKDTPGFPFENDTASLLDFPNAEAAPSPFTDPAPHSDSTISLDAELGMIDLNCKAAVAMTRLAIPYMSEGARIMQICSTAGFQPFQYLATYAASKAFLYRYSRALRVELFSRKIKVTAVCPYWIKDTEFIAVASDEDPKSGFIKSFPFASKEKGVAARSYRATMLGFPVATPSIMSTIHRVIAKIIPHEAMLGLWALLRRV